MSTATEAESLTEAVLSQNTKPKVVVHIISKTFQRQ